MITMALIIQYLQTMSFVNSVAVVGLSFLFFLIFLQRFVLSGRKMGSTSLPTVPGTYTLSFLFFLLIFFSLGFLLCAQIFYYYLSYYQIEMK